MEKSIEDIWKKGFEGSSPLVAPEVTDLYTKKSQHIIDKFMRMFRINLLGIVIGGFLGLIGLILLEMPITGTVMCLVLAIVFIVNKRELSALEKVDRSRNSYEYLKSFDAWMHGQISLNARMAKIYYPVIFLGMALGVWFSPHGPSIYNWIFDTPKNGWLLNGIPGFLLVPIAGVAWVLYVYGGRLYRIELNTFYGRVLNKLDELVAEMEDIRSNR